ncbi:MAG: hypothetical protein RLZZ46_1251 [Bacteroidota bacterium]|jgi:O-antigen ligase
MGGKAKTDTYPLSKKPHPFISIWGYSAIAALVFSLSSDRRFGVWFLVLAFIPAIFFLRSYYLREPHIRLLILFYLFHLWGMLFTDDLKEGWLDIQQKSAFLLFPLLVPLMRSFDKKRKDWLVLFYLAGLIITALISWTVALGNFWEESYARLHYLELADYPYTNYFFSGRLTRFIHPGYFAAMLLFGVFLLQKQYSALCLVRHNRMIILNIQLFFLLTIICSLSKSTILLLPVLLLFMFASSGSLLPVLRRGFWIIPISCFLLGLIISSIPVIRGGFANAWQAISNPQVKNPDTTTESSQLRLLTWKTAWQIFKEHPLAGVGTGDVNPALCTAYAESSYAAPAEKHLNAHNQFLQTAVALGLPGLMSLLSLPLFALYRGIKKKNNLWLLLGIMMFWLPMTECWLEQQHGMFFFLFWWSYLVATDEP